MKITIDLENLENLVQNSIEENIETVVRNQVDNVVRKMAEEVAKGAIEDKVSENFQRFVDEYIANTKIKMVAVIGTTLMCANTLLRSISKSSSKKNLNQILLGLRRLNIIANIRM